MLAIRGAIIDRMIALCLLKVAKERDRQMICSSRLGSLRKRAPMPKVDPVIQQLSTLDGEFIAEFPSLSAAAKLATGINGGNICLVCKGNSNNRTAGGFKWRYAEGLGRRGQCRVAVTWPNGTTRVFDDGAR